MFKDAWGRLPVWARWVIGIIPVLYIIVIMAFGYGQDYESQVAAYPSHPKIISFQTFMGLIDADALTGKLEIYANHKVFYDGLVSHSMGHGKGRVSTKRVYLVESFINSVSQSDLQRIQLHHNVKVLGTVKTLIINPVPGRSGAVMQGVITTASSVAIVIFYALIIYLMTKQGGIMKMIDRFRVVHGANGITLKDVAGLE